MGQARHHEGAGLGSRLQRLGKISRDKHERKSDGQLLAENFQAVEVTGENSGSRNGQMSEPKGRLMIKLSTPFI